MADTSGEADIRGIDIDKLAKGYADEDIVFKRFCTITPTSAREIRWYKKTSGILDSTDTTGITASQLSNVAELALPDVVEQSWTRQTSYVRKYFVESPWLSEEDIKDSDIQVLQTNVRDLTRAIAYQIDQRIWDVATESQSPTNINSLTTSGAWNTVGGGGVDIVFDIMDAKRRIRVDGYNPELGQLWLSPKDHQSILVYLISYKGASVPAWSSAKVESGVVMNLLGLGVVVSNNVTASYAAVIIPKRAVTWKTFTPLTAGTKTDMAIGTKIRVWERGEALLTDPKAVCLIKDTQV